MGYIKSHSNYVLKKKHKNINDGIIYERDITTVGGIEHFAPGQTPIYRDGSFLITVNSDQVALKTKKNNKWESNESGDVWTYSNVENYSSNTIEDDVILIKNDYRNLNQYAYYGSCSELVRTSLTDIFDRFPGELYSIPNSISTYKLNNLYNHEKGKEDEIKVKEGIYKIGYDFFRYDIDENGHITNERVESYSAKTIVLSNPFNIDLHTTYKTEVNTENKLKYFCNEGFLNYKVIEGNDEKSINNIDDENDFIVSWTSEVESGDTKCIGDLAYKIKITTKGGNEYFINAYRKTQKDFVYMTESVGIHIRPKKIFYDAFLKSLNYFQSTLLNPNTEPKYKATFQVFTENEYGYKPSLETFIFPIGEGGYNVGSSGSLYDIYVSKFLKYTELYDSKFCDNLYNQMTHESIKNFDWSYYINNDYKDEYQEGQTKIDKLIRLFGREFDEIRFYIEGIKNYNNISYSDRNNMPDYFLTDSLELDGWDINNIFPLEMKCYLDGELIDASGCTGETAIEIQNESGFTREFRQILNKNISPYSKNNIEDKKQNGYYILPNPKITSADCGNSSAFCETFIIEPVNVEKNNKRSLEVFTIGKNKVLKPKLKKYSTENLYTYKDINSIFLKRLKLNSRSLLRSKGTIHGIEMMLGLFGLKSKKFIEGFEKFDANGNLLSGNCNSSFISKDSDGKDVIGYDYEIEEYTTFTNGIEDRIWNCKDMHTIDWYNYTKTINYNTSNISNEEYVFYQGLPVIYRNIYYKTTDNGTVIDERIDTQDGFKFISYNKETKTLTYILNSEIYTEENVVEHRILYPYFNSYDIYDGNPYYQMNGGWINNKTLMYNKDNKIISAKTNNVDLDLFTETLDNIKKVEKVEDLFVQPDDELEDGNIFYVEDISGYYVNIDGKIYKLKEDGNGNKYFTLTVYDNSVTLGDYTFIGNMFVSNPYFINFEKIYNLNTMENGETIKVFSIESDGKLFITINDDREESYTLPPFNIFRFDDSDNTTHYFKIFNKNFKINFEFDGWYQLYKDDFEYIKVNTIKNYFKGNNPHNGNNNYDNGYKYIYNFSKLFNYSIDNNLFDYRMYKGLEYYEKQFIEKIGFKTLIATQDNDLEDASLCSNYYNTYKDSKIHYFGDYYEIDWYDDKENEEIEEIKLNYNDYTTWYDEDDYSDAILSSSTLSESNTLMETDENYNTHNSQTERYKNVVCSGASVDGSNYQIVNTKVISITFYLHSTEKLSEEYMTEIKYYQDVIMSYLEQMIPSNAILEIKFELKNEK